MIELQDATLSYGREPVSRGLNISVPPGSFTMIVGPNGCGKSTALRAMARMIDPSEGVVLLDGTDIRRLKTRQIATRLGLLAQQPLVPEGIRVAELVARGRHPHQGPLRQWSDADERAVADAMSITGISDLSARSVDRLSGGQRQRVWIAMVLAQETPLLLLDEPTTFLDLAHQLSILELCQDLVREQGRTVVAVVHDLTQACRYATHLVAMRSGSVIATGSPRDIVTSALIREVFGVEAVVQIDPATGNPIVIPIRTIEREQSSRERAS